MRRLFLLIASATLFAAAVSTAAANETESPVSVCANSVSNVVGWGSNPFYPGYEMPEPPAGGDHVAIAAGSYHFLALKADGSIVGWGEDYSGEATPPDGNDYVAVAAGTAFSLALKADGSIVGWGYNEDGQATPPDGNDYVAVAASGFHGLALKSNGSLVSWGWNDHYQDLLPPPNGDGYVAIDASFYGGLALKDDGSIVGWGGMYKYLGIPVTPPAGGDHVAIAAGLYLDLALKADGSIVNWGDREFFFDLGSELPTPPAGNDYVAIAAGAAHGLALKADGSIVGWGYNEDGQATPPDGNDYAAIAANGFHGLALIADPVTLIERMADSVIDLNLSNGLVNSVDAKLANAVKALDDVNENNNISAINRLAALISELEAQSGKKIPTEAADALISQTQRIICLLTA